MLRKIISTTLATLLALTGIAFGASSVQAAGALTVTPIGWGIVGLDSNRVTDGPDQFPAGVQVCNTTSADMPNTSLTWAWTTANAYIEVDGSKTRNIGTVAANSCVKAWWTAKVTRNSAAYDTSRYYTVTATSGAETTTSAADQLYVEHLVSQARNVVNGVTGPTTGHIGDTVTFTLSGATATNGYEQLVTAPILDSSMFEVKSVVGSYNVGGAINSFYFDACGWDPAGNSKTNWSCLNTGKAGGSPITVTVTAKIIGAGTATVGGIIYDFSGSSFHYNSDYSNSGFTITTTAAPARFSITKEETGAPVNVAGDDIGYTINMTNNGGVTLTNATITDSGATLGACTLDGASTTLPVASFAIGSVISCAATHTVTSGDMTAGSYSNTAVGSTSTAGALTANSNTVVTLLSSTPSMSVTKERIGTVVEAVGQTIEYTIKIKNDGTVDLSNVDLTDLNATIEICAISGVGSVTLPYATLARSKEIVCGATHVITQADMDAGQVVNTSTATSSTAGATSESSNTVTTPLTRLPNFNIEKAAVGSAPTVAGDSIDYTITVTNVGNVTLENLDVTDTNATLGACVLNSVTVTLPVAVLNVGASFECQASHIVTAGDMTAGVVTNVASGTSTTSGASSETSNTVTTNLSTTPALTIVKAITGTAATKAGDVINYSITVTNTGAGDIADLNVTDSNATLGACTLDGSSVSLPLATFAQGSVVICAATHTVTAGDMTAGKVDNTADATSTTTGLTSITSNKVTVTLTVNYDYEIKQELNGPAPKTPGEVVEYKIVIDNTGEGDLKDVEVTVDNSTVTKCQLNGVDVTMPLATFAVGDQLVCFAEHIATAADLKAGRIANIAHLTTTTASLGAKASNEIVVPLAALAETGEESQAWLILLGLLMMSGAVLLVRRKH